MNRTTTLLIIFFLSFCVITTARDYREDFEKGTLAGWDFGKRGKGEIKREKDNSFLKTDVKGKGAVPIPSGKWEDFDLSVDIRGVGGVHFRNGYKVFFKPNGNMWYRRPGAMLIRWVREERDLSKFHTIRIVCTGPILRIYVDSKLELECLDHNVAAAPISLRGNADFDNVRISDRIPKQEALIALPKDAGADFWEEAYYQTQKERGAIKGERVKDAALAFASSDKITVPVEVINRNGKAIPIVLRVTVDSFDDKLALPPLEKKATLAASSQQTLLCPLGKLKPGFYRLNIAIFADDKRVRSSFYPLFVGEKAAGAKAGVPTFPVGLFLRELVWKPVHTKTYWYAFADFMHRTHLNTVVATGGCHREFPEIFERYGICVLVRSANRQEYPSVIGRLNTNARPEKMIEFQKKESKPVITYLKATEVGTGKDDDPLRIWKTTAPQIRMLLIYPFGRAGETLKLEKALRATRDAAPTPWWAILQANGMNSPDADQVNPTPAQISMETHMALAYGAKAILYYCLQGAGNDLALVDPISLKVVDKKAEAIANLAALIEKHATLLKKLRPAPFTASSDRKELVVVPLTSDGANYLYVVNSSTKNGVLGQVKWHKRQAKRILDVFDNGKGVPVKKDGESIKLNLQPGEGKLLKLVTE